MKRSVVNTLGIMVKVVAVVALLDLLIFGLDSDRPDAMNHTFASGIALVACLLLTAALTFVNRYSK